MSVVVRNIRRVERAVVEGYAGIGVATVHEAQGRTGLLAPYMRPIYPGRPCRRNRGDGGGAAGRQLDDPMSPSSSAAKATSWSWRRPRSAMAGYFGELLASSLAARGVRGLIIDAGRARRPRAVGDEVPRLVQGSVGAGARSRRPWAASTSRSSAAGALIHAGDLIVADDDGVVVVRRKDAAGVLEASRSREEKESRDPQAPEGRRARPSTSTRCASGWRRRASNTSTRTRT